MIITESDRQMPYIKLITSEPLDKITAKQWADIVAEYAPHDVEVDRKIIDKKTGNMKSPQYHHEVTLSRELKSYEAEFIVAAWEYVYDGDFEIETSVDYHSIPTQSNDVEYSVDEDVMKNITEQINRILHNRWLDEKISSGWRYGLYLNLQEKTHPALQNWDNLPRACRNPKAITEHQIIEFFMKNPNLFT